MLKHVDQAVYESADFNRSHENAIAFSRLPEHLWQLERVLRTLPDDLSELVREYYVEWKVFKSSELDRKIDHLRKTIRRRMPGNQKIVVQPQEDHLNIPRIDQLSPRDVRQAIHGCRFLLGVAVKV